MNLTDDPKGKYLMPNQRAGYEKPADVAKVKPKHTESAMQEACVTWFKLQYPRLFLYANVNHGKRGIVAGAHEKAAGLVAGVPDLFLAVMRSGFGGMYIELKVAPNKPSEAQLLAMTRLLSAGYQCKVCYSFDDFQQAVEGYLSKP